VLNVTLGYNALSLAVLSERFSDASANGGFRESLRSLNGCIAVLPAALYKVQRAREECCEANCSRLSGTYRNGIPITGLSVGGETAAGKRPLVAKLRETVINAVTMPILYAR